jgi:hypothetical protein
LDPPPRPWHRQLSEMTSRSADFDSRASSDASETKGIDPPPCIAVLNSLCFAGRFIRPQSTQSVQRQSVLQSRLVSRLVVWGWGSCSAGCPAGARLRAPRVRISQPAQSMSLLPRWRCCGATVRHSNFDQLQGEVASAGCRHSGQRDDAGNVRAISWGVVSLVQFRIS